MSLYHDPELPYLRPSLIGDLLAVPATKEQHQLENQTTTVLAWLVDRCPAIGRSVLRLFLGDQTAVDGKIGARTQLSLAKPNGGVLYPDLSICVSGQARQLLVEVKVDSVMAEYPEFDGALQPDVYRVLWKTPAPGDAHARAVGTLTRTGGPAEPDPDQLVVRDVSWRELRDAIDATLKSGEADPSARTVAESFVAAIDERIAPAPLTNAAQQAFFAEHSPLLNAVASGIANVIKGTGPRRKIRGEAYFGWRIPLPDPTGQPLFLRLYLSPAGTRLNLPGAPDALIAAPERDADGTLEKPASDAAQAAGFLKTKDFDKYWLHRRVWPLEALVAEAAAHEIVDGLAKTGLLPEGAI